jgi:dUTP pyrophosphatase
MTPLMHNDIEEFKGNNLIRKNKYDAGCDIRSSEDVKINPKQSVKVHTGLHVAIPYGYVGLISGRSSGAFKADLELFNGRIDGGYRGEIMIKIKNDDNQPFYIEKGDRVAQMVVVQCMLDDFIEVNELPPTIDNRDGGFGSTGTN